MSDSPPPGAVQLVDLWHDDSLWQWIWAAAIGVAVVVHAVAFFAMSGSPAKERPQPIAMSINMPPPPPPPERQPDPPRKKAAETPPPAPAAAPLDNPPPVDAPPPLSTLEPINLGPSTGQGVAVAVGTADGVAGAPPVSGSGPPPETNRAQAGPPPAVWDPNGYKSNAWDMMNSAKRYPRKAEVMGIEGKCMVKVMINHDGSLNTRPSITGKGTGNELLDEECIAMAERVKFPPIPAEVDAPVTYRFPVEFKLLNR